MCGIGGRVNTNTNNNINTRQFSKMIRALYHRGPDDEGAYINKNIGLGFRRLSIIDLNAGHQPMSNEDNSIWIVFNGEIYNFKDLREQLIKKDHKFKTNTDTEVIIHLYEDYGARCVEHLRGMFSFAIWDENKKRLFCARDRFGIKPFYYYSDNEKLIFASEIKAILENNNLDKTIDLWAMDSYFTYGYITSDHSIYKSINKLPPAHYLLYDHSNQNITINKYWDIQIEPDYSKNESYWKERLSEVFSEAVKIRLMSDVPLGAFLSGGIDSSSVVAMMATHSSGPVKTFSIGFEEESHNEIPIARTIAQKYNTEHYEHILKAESIDIIKEIVNSYDEPFADSSAIPTYYVSKFARQYVKTVLSGDGGDELFAGYNSYHKLNKIAANPLNNPIINKISAGINRMIPDYLYGKGLSYYYSKNPKYLPAYYEFWKDYERKKLYLNGLKGSLQNETAVEYKKRLIDQGNQHGFITNFQELDMITYLVDDILTKVDRASMMNSLEVRIPLLDHKLAELTFKIPPEIKYKHNQPKYLFKNTMAPYLTSEVLNHKKQGFGIPINKWFREDLNNYIIDQLDSNSNPLYSFVNKKYVKKIIHFHMKDKRDFSQKLWSLLYMSIWLKNQKEEINGK